MRISLTRFGTALATVVSSLLFCSCQTTDKDNSATIDTVLGQQERDSFSPAKVVKLLTAGNERFVNGALTKRNHSKQIREAVAGQYPKAIVLSCVDSRVPVEDVFDLGIGDIFVARVAGNCENTDILGSMEYACKVAGSKVIMVLGHEHCGAVKSAIDDVKLGNITALLENIRPATKAFQDYVGKRTSKNLEFLHMVAEQNVRNTLQDIRSRSPILAGMENKGGIQLVGGIYNMSTGKVMFVTD
jgi:carbonic anhydrase